MTTVPSQALVSACTVEGCLGDLYLLPYGVYRCTAVDPDHDVRAADLAACSECDGPQNSDRVTVSRALTEGWGVAEDGRPVCPEHVGTCRQCDRTVPLGEMCCLDSWRGSLCTDCGPCSDCIRDGLEEQKFAAAWEERGR